MIPLNPVDVLPFERPDPRGIERFAETVREAGVAAAVRYSRGLEIDAACGQLRAKAQAIAREANADAAVLNEAVAVTGDDLETGVN